MYTHTSSAQIKLCIPTLGLVLQPWSQILLTAGRRQQGRTSVWDLHKVFGANKG